MKTASAANQIPKLLNYQARITNASGVPVSDGNLNIWISVYDASSGGSCLYAMRGSCGTPSFKTVTVTNGVFSTLIGDTAGGDNEIPDTLFDADTLYLGVTVASDTEMVPRKRITAAPYALNADKLDDLDVTSSGSTTPYVVATTSNGNLVITGDPQGGTVSAGSVYINPAGATGGETLFGIADNGTNRWMIDKEGDVTHSGSLLATAASSTAQFVFRGAASQSQNIFEVQDANLNRMLAVSATATTIGSTSSTDAVVFNSRVGSNFTPTTDATFSLGDYNRRWKDLWLSGGSANIAYDTSGTSVMRLGFETTQGLRGTVSTPTGIPLQIRSGLGTTTGGIYINGSNNVGVGTVSPVVPFHVKRSSNGEGMRLEGTTNDIYWITVNPTVSVFGAAIWDNPSADPNYPTGLHGFFGTGTAHPLSFRTNNISRMIITSAGSVGIGTHVPDTKFHVMTASAGTVTATGNTVITAENNTNAYISILTPDASESGVLFGSPVSSVAGGIIYNSAATLDGLQFRTNGNNTRMVVDDAGDVGIGNTAPANRLTVGSATSTFEVDAAGNLIKVNNVAYSWPSAQGAASTVLQNNGSGTLAWVSSSGLVNLNQAYLASTSTAEISLSPSIGAMTIADTFPGAGNIFEIQDRTDAAGDYSTRYFTVSATGTVVSGATAPQFYVQSPAGTISYAQFHTSTTGFNGASDGLTVGINANDSYVMNRETTNLYLGTSGQVGLAMNSARNVGIGTTTPGARLVVADASTSPTGNVFQIANSNDSARYLTVSSTSTLIDSGNLSGYKTGIGTASPSQILTVANGTIFGNALNVTTTVNGVAGGAKFFTGETFGQAAIFGNGSLSAMTVPTLAGFGSVGVVGSAGWQSGGRTHVGVYGYAQIAQPMGANSANVAEGGYFKAEATSAVTDYVGKLYGVLAEADASAASGANAAAVYGLSATATGITGTTAYGLYVGATGGTSNYGIYSNAATNYFSGNVGVGQTAPTARLHVVPAANDEAIAVTGYSITGSSANTLLSLSGTWNTSGAPIGILLNVTDTSSSGNSTLMTLQQSGTTRFNVSKIGTTSVTLNSASTSITSSSMLNLINSDLSPNNYSSIYFSDGLGVGSMVSNQFVSHGTSAVGNLVFTTRDNAGAFGTRLTVGATSTDIVGDLTVTGSISGTISTSLNQAYLNSTSTAEISLSPSIGALTVADTFSGTGNIFELQDRTNATGDYSERYLTVSSTSTNITVPTVLGNASNGGAGTLLSFVNDVGDIEFYGTGEDAFNFYTDGTFFVRIDANNNSSNNFQFVGGGNTTFLTLDEFGRQTLNPLAVGTLLDATLDTEWTSGTLFNADFGGTTTQTSAINGVVFDFNTNLTALPGSNVTGYDVQTPVLVNGTANSTTYTGYNISAAGALTNSGTGTFINWRGLNVVMPVTQTVGNSFVSATGVNVTGTASNSGSRTGLGIEMGQSTGGAETGIWLLNPSSGGGSEIGVRFGPNWDAELRFDDASPLFQFADGSTTTLADTSANTLMTIVDAGTTGNLSVTGNLAIGSASGTNTVDFTNARIGSNLTPTTDATYDLGDYNRRWRDLWLSGGSLNVAYDTSGTSIMKIGFETTQGYRARIATPSGTPLQLRSGLGTTNQGLSIDGLNNVGIGTTSPQRELHIASAGPGIYLTENDQAADTKTWGQSVSNSTLFNFTRNDADSVSSNWLRVMRSGNTVSNVIFENGNVGIGSLTPSSKLVVADGSASPTGNIFQVQNSNDSSRYLTVSSTSTAVGTSNPLARLHVANGSSGISYTPNVRTAAIIEGNNSNGTILTITGPATGNANGIFLGSPTNESAAQITYDNTNGALSLATGGGAVASTLYFSPSAQFGIGNVTPSAKLTLSDSSVSPSANIFEIQNTSGGGGYTNRYLSVSATNTTFSHASLSSQTAVQIDAPSLTSGFGLVVNAATSTFTSNGAALSVIGPSSGTITTSSGRGLLADFRTSAAVQGTNGAAFYETYPGITTGLAHNISLGDSFSTGTGLSISARSANFSSGKLLSVQKTTITSGSVAFTGDVANFGYLHTITGGANGLLNTGNVLDVSRTVTVNGGTPQLVGALATFSDDVVLTTGWVRHAANVVQIAQNWEGATNTALSVVSSATGGGAAYVRGAFEPLTVAADTQSTSYNLFQVQDSTNFEGAYSTRYLTVSSTGTTIANLTVTGSCTGCGGGGTLQSAYTASTDPEITLDATRGALTLKDAASPIGANLFEVIGVDPNNGSAGARFFTASSTNTELGNQTLSFPENNSVSAQIFLNGGGGTILRTNGSVDNITFSDVGSSQMTFGNMVSASFVDGGFTTGSGGNFFSLTSSTARTSGSSLIALTDNGTPVAGSSMLELNGGTNAAGNGISLTMNSLTTGTGISIASSGTGLTSGSLLTLTSATTGVVATNGIVEFEATGNFSSTSNIGLLSLKANSTTAGTVMNLQANALTTGQGLRIGSTSTLTSGNLLNVTSSGAGALSSGLVRIESTGGFTSSASETGMLTIYSQTSTAGTLLGMNGDNTTTGTLIHLAAHDLTTGNAITAYNFPGAGFGITTGHLLDFDGRFRHTTTNEIGSLAKIVMRDISTVTSTSIGLYISPEFSSASVSGTRTLTGIKVDPTFASAGANCNSSASHLCVYNGIDLTTPSRSVAVSNTTLTFNGLNLSSSGALNPSASGAYQLWNGIKLAMPSASPSSGAVVSATAISITGPVTVGLTDAHYSILDVATSTFSVSTGVDKAINLNMAFTSTSANNTGLYGININPQFNLFNTSAGTKALAAINVENPTYTQCVTGSGKRCGFYGAIIGGLGTSVTHTSNDTLLYHGIDINQESNSLTQSGLAGTVEWRGISMSMPNITQTTGTVTSTAIEIIPGNVTSGTAYAITTGSSSSTLAVDFSGVRMASNLTPTVDDTYDLGDWNRRWRDLYLGPGSLHIGNSTGDEAVLSYNSASSQLEVTTNGVAAAAFTSVGDFKIERTGDAVIRLVADTDNVNEDDNPYILFSQDNGIVSGLVGMGDTNTNCPDGTSCTGQRANALDVANLYSGADIQFMVNVGGTMTEGMNVDGATGYVGIGQSAPSYQLDVSGYARVSSGIGAGGQAPTAGYGIWATGSTMGGRFENGAGTTAYVGYGSYGVYTSGATYGGYLAGGTYGLYAGGSGSSAYLGYGSTYGVYVPSNASTTYGMVGYGVSTGARFYDYDGTATTFIAGASWGVEIVTGGAVKPGGGSWSAPSDIRTKKDVTDFTDGLATIRQLRPVNYTYNGLAETPEGYKGIGFIAQEVEPVAPYLIQHEYKKLYPDDATNTEILLIDPSAVPFINMNAIKQLDATTLQMGDDGVFLLKPDTTNPPPAYASATQTAIASRELSFVGAAWDAASSTSVTRSITMGNVVTDMSDYQMAFKNDLGQTLASLNNMGDLALAGSLSVNGGFDYAEQFPATPDLDAGDIVMVDAENASGYGVKKSDKAYENTVIGVISTKPGFITGKKEEDSQPVALAGRVPVKVSAENGEIKPGDPITSSSAAGVGMKATEAGRVVGIALQGWNGSDVGVITLFVNPSWWNGPSPATGAMASGSLSITQDSLLDFKNSVLSNVAAIISTNGTWSVTADGYLAAVKVDAKQVEAEAYTVRAGSDPAGRMVGVGRIAAGGEGVMVSNPAITADSLIVVTFESNPGTNWWIGEKHDGLFVLKLASPAHDDLKFTYWIVGVDGALDPAATDSGSGTPQTAPTDSGTGTPQTAPTDSGTGTPDTGGGGTGSASGTSATP